MVEITEEIIEKICGKPICVQEVKFKDDESAQIFGDKKTHTLTFTLYDGFGFCNDYKGKQFFLTYPTLAFLKNCEEMSQSVREFNGLQDEDEITVPQIVYSYCKLVQL